MQCYLYIYIYKGGCPGVLEVAAGMVAAEAEAEMRQTAPVATVHVVAAVPTDVVWGPG